MHRPSRQLNNLIQKIARKESLAKAHNRKGGKRVKQWKKSVEAFKSLAQDAS